MPAEVLLNIRGVIRGDIVFEPASIQFGDINQGTEIEKKVRVSHYGWGEWKSLALLLPAPIFPGKY